MSDKQALLAEIEAAYQALNTALGSVAEADWDLPSNNPGWTNRQVLTHLVRVQARQRSQLDCARGLQPWWPDSADEYNARTIDEWSGRDIQQLRDDLARETEATLALFGSLSAEDLAVTFVHPVRGQQTFADVMQRFADHMRGHTAEICPSPSL
jgi:uncharacterized protein (TIGR03083 family)